MVLPAFILLLVFMQLRASLLLLVFSFAVSLLLLVFMLLLEFWKMLAFL